MKYAAAAMLLSLSPDPMVSSQKIKNILESVGIEPDQERLDHFIEQLGDRSVKELIDVGMTRMATFSVGAPGGGAPAAAAATEVATHGKSEAKEDSEGEKEESEEDFGFGLFD